MFGDYDNLLEEDKFYRIESLALLLSERGHPDPFNEARRIIEEAEYLD